eukprot:CAMPEP_0113936892 /NCGR_PEP_ID=MMETSP1339-20121228/3644_1 /TAXON_ID=94617 /ORGANISM="Fibrocapsa japonica" /LENGTH=107 /DNA_ID=CAMNT_0000939461 /DNA_START=105 /DNA_END=428 /DNA_ORIENTATION=- /assembly_acc=CAM_ASM_000762
MPRLSPTHTQARIIRLEVSNGDHVVEYDPVFTVECSADLVTPAFRNFPDQKLKMIVETQEEGTITKLETKLLGQWVEVGTNLGVIDDGDPVDGEWMWQAYSTNSNDE